MELCTERSPRSTQAKLHFWEYEADMGCGMEFLSLTGVSSYPSLFLPQEAMELHEKWVNEYGPTIRYASFAGVSSTL